MDVQIEHDSSYYRTSSRMAIVLWLALLILMTATLLGVFGSGPVSRATVRSGNGAVELRYQRFLRFGSTTSVTIDARAGGRPLVLAIDRAYLDDFRIQNIHPEPDRMASFDGGVRYEFDPAGTSVRVRFDLQPATAGPIAGRLQTNTAALRWSQFVYP